MALAKDLIARIRHIFLHPRPHVSIMTAAHLLGWTVQQMKAAIAEGQIQTNTTPLATWVWREELVVKALELWPIEIIEKASGNDAERIRPAALRTHAFRARIPRYQFAMLQYFAEECSTTVNDVLTRELEDVASAQSEKLTRVIPGFREALTYPAAPDADRAC
jgi:hypothetical protein